jgi:hypothetical protein
MVAEARDALHGTAAEGRVRFVVAPADRLPLGDGAVDTAVCHRLLHHMEADEERAGVLRELARVARRRVIASFSDGTTWKAKSQGRRGVERRRHLLAPERLFAEAAAHGLHPIGRPIRLCGFTSLLAVAVFEVREAGA